MSCLLIAALLTLTACGGGDTLYVDEMQPMTTTVDADAARMAAGSDGGSGIHASEAGSLALANTVRIAASRESTGATGCRYEARLSFGQACSAFVSATWADGETISVSNTRSGYSGAISASCKAGSLSWSPGTCQANAATGTHGAGSSSASPDLSRMKVFTATPPYYVESKAGNRRVVLGMYGTNDDVPRSHDFVAPLVNKATGHTDVLTVQTTVLVNGKPSFVNLSDHSAPRASQALSTGRYELRNDGLHLAYLANDPASSEKLRTQVNSWPIPTRRLLSWDLSVRFAGETAGERWPLTKFAASPVLIWQLKSDPGFPPMGMLVDVDPENPSRALQLTFFQRDSNVQAYSRRWIVGGLDPNVYNDIVIQAVPDDRESSEGGIGWLKVWINKNLVVSTSGRNLIPGLPELNRWAFGLYMTAESEPSPLPRYSNWRRARMLVESN